MLLIDSDQEHLKSFREDISKDYLVDVAQNGEEGSFLAHVNDYDVVVVDGPIFDVPEYEICQNVRLVNKQAALIVLGDRIDPRLTTIACVACLDSGADVFLATPLMFSEINAQIRALLRKKKDFIDSYIVSKPNLELNLKSHEIKICGLAVYLRRKEYDILEYLFLNAERIISKEEILEHLWCSGLETASNTVEVHIRSLRQKIEKPFGIIFIKTVKGFGYKYTS